ncbi:MAG: MSEP-CTERM sorting domain-containing protein [Nibricoccus sp.]
MDAPIPTPETADHNAGQNNLPEIKTNQLSATTGQPGEVTLPDQVTFERETGETDLLPAFLLKPSAMLWLWVMPVAILLALNLQGFQLVEGNMDAQQKSMAGWLGLAGGVNALFGIASYFALRSLKRRENRRSPILPYWGLFMVVVEVAYLWLAASMEGKILPASVTTWIYPTDRYFFNQFAFAMVPLFYGVLLLACGWRIEDARKGFVTGMGLAVGAPVLAYLGVQLVFRAGHFQAAMVATIFVLLGLAMFVGLIRVLAAVLKSVRKTGTAGELWAITVFALAMPIGGLLLNREIPFPVDFQAWEVYALTLANTAILFLAAWKKAKKPMLSFSLLCFSFPFSLYFFVVFLPYTPLSIVGVIVFGLGFLVLTPTVLFVLHLSQLTQVLRGPLANHRRGALTAVGLVSFFVLPALYTARGLADKAALNTALNYIYTPSVKAGPTEYPGSLLNLERALRNHRAYKNGIYYPILSDYYSWLVFDNLVLPDGKLAQLEAVFLGKEGSGKNADLLRNRGGVFGGSSVRARTGKTRALPMSRDVVVKGLDVRTLPAGESASVVTMTLTLEATGTTSSEYVQPLTLPAGIYVSGLRLHMNGVPVAGRIFEKKTAYWVYEMIRDSERRDPALLAYTSSGQLELRVFPVMPTTPTVVELDFLVPIRVSQILGLPNTKNPATALNDLGDRLGLQMAAGEWGSVIAGQLPEAATNELNNEAYLHLIVDRSEGNGFDGDLVNLLRILKVRFPSVDRMRITTANFAVTDTVAALTPIDQLIGSPEPLRSALPLRGGFGLDLALAHALRLHRDEDLDKAESARKIPARPIFVVAARKALLKQESLPLTERWTDILASFELHVIDATGQCQPVIQTGAASTIWLRKGASIRPIKELRGAQFPASTRNGAGALEYWSPSEKVWRVVSNNGIHKEGSPWSQAARLEMCEGEFARSPGENPDGYREVVEASKTSGILLPETSYIAVENAAQWRMLEKAEETKLGQNAALDHVETPAPPIVWVGLGFGLWLLIRRRCNGKVQTCPAAN